MLTKQLSISRKLFCTAQSSKPQISNVITRVFQLKKRDNERKRTVEAEVELEIQTAAFMTNETITNQKTDNLSNSHNNSFTNRILLTPIAHHAANNLLKNNQLKEIILRNVQASLKGDNTNHNEDLLAVLQASSSNLLDFEEINVLIHQKLIDLLNTEQTDLFIQCVKQNNRVLLPFLEGQQNKEILTDIQMDGNKAKTTENGSKDNLVNHQDNNGSAQIELEFDIDNLEDTNQDNLSQQASYISNNQKSNPNKDLLANYKPDNNNPFRVKLNVDSEKTYFIDNLHLKMIELSLLENKTEVIYEYKDTLSEMAATEHNLYALYLLSKLRMTNQNQKDLVEIVEQLIQGEISNEQQLQMYFQRQTVRNKKDQVKITQGTQTQTSNKDIRLNDDQNSLTITSNQLCELLYTLSKTSSQHIQRFCSAGLICVLTNHETLKPKDSADFFDILNRNQQFLTKSLQNLLIEKVFKDETTLQQFWSSKMLLIASKLLLSQHQTTMILNMMFIKYPPIDNKYTLDSAVSLTKALQTFTSNQYHSYAMPTYEIDSENKLIIHQFIMHLLDSNMLSQRLILSGQIMDIATNTRMQIDRVLQEQWITNTVEFIQAEFKEMKEINRKSQSNINTGVSVNDKNKVKELIYCICSLFRFIGNSQLYEIVKPETARELFQSIISVNHFNIIKNSNNINLANENSIRALVYIYQSILSKAPIENLPCLRLSAEVLNQINQISDDVSQSQILQLCVPLRNFLTKNTPEKKQYIVLFIEPKGFLDQMIDCTSNLSQSSLSESQQNKINTSNTKPQQLVKIPFKVEWILNIPNTPSTKSLRLYLQQIVSPDNIQSNKEKTAIILEDMKKQMKLNIPNTQSNFENIRTNIGIRKLLQTNNQFFSVFQEYVYFLMQHPNLIPQENSASSSDQQDSISSQLVPLNSPQNKKKYGNRILTEVLFYSRILQEKNIHDPSDSVLETFLQKYFTQLDIDGVMFSKQALNTRGIRNTILHNGLQRQLQWVLSVSGSYDLSNVLCMNTSLNLIKSFSLNDFDDRTQFRLEHEVAKKISYVNDNNIAVLSRKYFFKAQNPPVRFMSALTQNLLNSKEILINSYSIWMVQLIYKFKRQILLEIDTENILFQSGISKADLIKIIEILASTQLQFNLRKQIQMKMIANENNSAGDIMELVKQDKNEQDRLEIAMQIKKARILKEKLRDYTRIEKGLEEIYEVLSENQCSQIDFRIKNQQQQGKQQQRGYQQHHQQQQQQQTKISAFDYLLMNYYLNGFKTTFKPSQITALVDQLLNEYYAVNRYRKEANQSDGSNLTYDQLVLGLTIAGNAEGQNNLISQETLQKLMMSFIDCNKNQNLENTPSLGLLLNLHQLISQSPQNQSTSKSITQQQSQLGNVFWDNFLFYRMKQNESKDDILEFINIILETRKQNPMIKSNENHLKILDKIEKIVILRMNSWNVDDTLDILNVYFQNDLSSFAFLETVDRYLAEIGINNSKNIQRLIESAQESHNHSQSIAYKSAEQNPEQQQLLGQQEQQLENNNNIF